MKRTRFTIKQLLGMTTIIGLLLAILRRPLAILIFDSDDFWFGTPIAFRHLPWLLGFDANYPTSQDMRGRSEWVVAGLLAGMIASAIFHLFLVVQLYRLIQRIHYWMNKR